MELSKLVEEILKITNESPCGWLNMDSSEAGEIWKLLNKEQGYEFFEKTPKTTMTVRLLEDLHKLGYKIVKQEPKKCTLTDVSKQRKLLIAFLEMNNWLSLEDEENAKGVVDCYLKAIDYIPCCKSDSEMLSKRPNTSSTWECFTKADKQKKGNI